MASIFLFNIESPIMVPCAEKWRAIRFPTGLSLIAAVLFKEKHKITVLDNYVPNVDINSILNEVEKQQPDYLLITGFIRNSQYGFLKSVSHKLRRIAPHAIQIMGGPMATTIPKLILKNFSVNYLVIGEGEETILDLFDALQRKRDISEVKGIGFCDNRGNAIITEKRARIKDFSKMPLPPYELFDMGFYIDHLARTGRCWELLSSRGCIGRCTYCKPTFGRELSFRPVQNIIEEMNFIKKNYGIDRFNFVDDNFLNSNRIIDEFISSLKSCKEKYKFRFQGRIDRVDQKLARRLREVGCFGISFGLESGSEKILSNIRKPFKIKKAEENLKGILDEGLEIHTTFLVGTPLEDEATVDETKQFIRRVGITNVDAGILIPLPGTEVYHLAIQRGIIKDEEEYCGNLGTVFGYEKIYINLTEYSDETLIKWRNEINDSVNR